MITCRNLTYRYGRRSTDGISDINFKAKKNSVNAIIGPSGAGKTTLLKCLYGEIKDFQGDISFSEKVSLGFLQNQSIENIDSTVLEYLLEALMSTDDQEKDLNRVRTILSDLEITNEIDNKVSSLSSGQKQRLLIAKTLVNNPTVLLLDEPFANLDNNLRDILLKDFFTLLKEKEVTIIWVTHNTNEALKFSDQILLMQYGQLEQMASPKEMYYKPKNIFAAQFFGENNILSSKLVKTDSEEITFETLGKDWSVPFSEKIGFENFLVMVRPEFIYLDEDGPLKATLINKYFEGSITLLEFQCGTQVVRVHHLGVDETKIQVEYTLNIKAHGFYPLLG